MRTLLKHGSLVVAAFFTLDVEASAQLPFLELTQANVDSGRAVVEVMVRNPQTVDITVTSYHLTVVKEKLFVSSISPVFASFVFNALSTPVIAVAELRDPVPVVGRIDVLRRSFLNTVTPTTLAIQLQRQAPAGVVTRNRVFGQDVVFNVVPQFTICRECGQVLNGLTVTRGPLNEDGLWLNLSAMQASHHTHTNVAQNVLTGLSTTSAPAVDVTQVVNVNVPTRLFTATRDVFDTLQFDDAVVDVDHEHLPIVYECPLIYDQPPTVVSAGQSATLTVPLPDVTVGDIGCIPVAGDRVIIHAYNPIGAWVLQALKTAQ